MRGTLLPRALLQNAVTRSGAWATERTLRTTWYNSDCVARMCSPPMDQQERGPWQVTVGRNGDGTTTNLDRTNGDVVAAAFRLEATTVDPFGKAPVDQLPVECWHW